MGFAIGYAFNNRGHTICLWWLRNCKCTLGPSVCAALPWIDTADALFEPEDRAGAGSCHLQVIRSRRHFARPRASSSLKCLARVGWQQPISAAISACVMPFAAISSTLRRREAVALKGRLPGVIRQSPGGISPYLQQNLFPAKFSRVGGRAAPL